MNPADNLILAKFLGSCPDRAPKEAAIRGACGRAYYAAFATARDALVAARFGLKYTGDDHGRVISALKQSADPEVAAAGSLLDQLRKERARADYEVGLVPSKSGPFVQSRSSRAAALAQTIIDEIDRASRANPQMGIPSKHF